jgi:hypothetical protein
MKSHSFEISGGVEKDPERKGKVIWPDCLNVRMNKFHAWNLVETLINQLRDGEDICSFSHCGKLDYDEEE